MIPFIKEPEIEVEVNNFNPNLYVTMADRVDNRIWSPNTYPWIEGEGATAVVITDTYNESNRDSAIASFYLGGSNQFVGQTFTCPESASIDHCVFYLQRFGNPTGSLRAKLYNVSSLSSVPTTGSTPIATSVSRTASDISTSTYQLITFTFTSIVSMTAGSYYAIVLDGSIGDINNRVNVGFKDASPTHLGIKISSADGTTWTFNSTDDLCFYVYGRITMPTSSSIYNVVNYSSPWLIP